ncbi:MAG TPA: hypothetical protein VE727_04535, partial [Solirubrobacterales bacterium]|nr:hypothetical protein [Solirubrobacterales bacterium]
MGIRPRIRWQNAAKLGAAALACAGLLLFLPSLTRNPEAPPLASDIGLVPRTISRPATTDLHHREPRPRGERVDERR